MRNIRLISEDTVVVEDLNIDHFCKSWSCIYDSHKKYAKDRIKDCIKRIDNLDKCIEILSTLPKSKKKYRMLIWKFPEELAKFIDDHDLQYALYCTSDKEYRTIDELILGCNAKIEKLEKELISEQDSLNVPFDDASWRVHLEPNENCDIYVKGLAGKKVYHTLLDRKNHTFVFRIDPKSGQNVIHPNSVCLHVIDAEEA